MSNGSRTVFLDRCGEHKVTTVRFDVNPVKARLLAACEASGVPVSSEDLPVRTGVYLIRHLGTHPLYERFGERPLYVGRATGVRQRIHTHRRTLDQAHDLAASDFAAVCITTDGRAVAALYEELLIAHYRPVWNQWRVAGFGNRDPGARRRKQRTSPFDRLHPGRQWARGPVDPCPELAAWVMAYD